MISQASFNFDAPATPAEVETLGRLLAYLQSHPGFHTAKHLSADLGLSDRAVRRLAASSGGVVVSGPGSPGYCHIRHCPTEQLVHIADTLRSQGKAMIQRSLRIRRCAHAMIR